MEQIVYIVVTREGREAIDALAATQEQAVSMVRYKRRVFDPDNVYRLTHSPSPQLLYEWEQRQKDIAAVEAEERELASQAPDICDFTWRPPDEGCSCSTCRWYFFWQD